MKTLFVSIVLASITLLAITLSVAQSTSSPTHEMHMNNNMTMSTSMNHENMEGMGQLMMKMGNTLEKHQMTDEQRGECARFMSRLGRIMMSCAGDVELKATDKHKADIKEITKEWNYFERGNFEEH